MKKQIPTWLAAIIVVVIILIVGIVYIKADMGGKAKTEKMEMLIRATAATGASIKGAPDKAQPVEKN